MAPPCVLIGAFLSAVLTIKFTMTSITKRKFIIPGEGFYRHSHSFGKCSAGSTQPAVFAHLLTFYLHGNDIMVDGLPKTHTIPNS